MLCGACSDDAEKASAQDSGSADAASGGTSTGGHAGAGTGGASAGSSGSAGVGGGGQSGAGGMDGGEAGGAVDAGPDASGGTGPGDASADGPSDASSSDGASPDGPGDASPDDASSDGPSDASSDGASSDGPSDAAWDVDASDADSGCVAGVPWGTYSLQLHNENFFCQKSTLTCTLDDSQDGQALLTVTGVELLPGSPGEFALQGHLNAPTLSLNYGSGDNHEEDYSFVVLPSGFWTAGNSAPSLTDTICPDPPGSGWGDGNVQVNLNLTTGAVTSFTRLCEVEFMTIFYRTVTTGTGTRVCP
jgi:hypothetical protein